MGATFWNRCTLLVKHLEISILSYFKEKSLCGLPSNLLVEKHDR
jgi:hypothetical protein